MGREIKFRAWDKTQNIMFKHEVHCYPIYIKFNGAMVSIDNNGEEDVAGDLILMQFTGLLDKNGKEIYEFMELDNKYEVDFLNGQYILRDISNNDIIKLNYENKYTITKEYTKI